MVRVLSRVLTLLLLGNQSSVSGCISLDVVVKKPLMMSIAAQLANLLACCLEDRSRMIVKSFGVDLAESEFGIPRMLVFVNEVIRGLIIGLEVVLNVRFHLLNRRLRHLVWFVVTFSCDRFLGVSCLGGLLVFKAPPQGFENVRHERPYLLPRGPPPPLRIPMTLNMDVLIPVLNPG